MWCATHHLIAFLKVGCKLIRLTPTSAKTVVMLRNLNSSTINFPPRSVAEAKVQYLSSLTANFHLFPPLGGWLYYFELFFNICMVLLLTILHTTNKVWHYCRQYFINQINQSKIEWPSHCQNDKKDSPELNLRHQGSLFPEWYKRSRQNWTYDLKGPFFWCGIKGLDIIEPTTSRVSPSGVVNHTVSLLIPCKQPASCRSCAIGTSLFSYAHKLCHWHILTTIKLFIISIYNETFLIYLSWGRLYVWS